MSTAPRTPQQPTSTLVLGLGKTGYSVVEHLAARGDKITVADSRAVAPCLAQVRARHPGVEVVTGRLPQERFGQFDRIVVSPGIAVKTGGAQRLVGDIELFAESARAPVIAITGSNGKSTVTTMVAALLQGAGRRALSGGNLGPPALQLLAEPAPDFYVLELSSFQLESTHSLAPAAAAILNISQDHLDRYPDMRRYIEAKARILERAATRVLNRDDPGLAALRSADPAVVSFGLGRPPGERDYGVMDTARGRFLCKGRVPLAAVERLSVPGAHNIANALAALALMECAGVSATPAAVEALLAYRGLEHRCEMVADIAGVRWINDSKGTNVGATAAAIQGLHGAGPDLILIAGGLGKGADFAPLQAPVGRCVGHAVLFGHDAPRIAAALAGHTRIARAADLPQAVAWAARHARAGQVVLFSPACASFDQFDDYRARGLAFKQLVGELEQAQ
ncbi:MAG: UDP-N-acetylmuramoyl-L-alanine--D-glutamate ligase [Gammaproteobacteria bacterium]|nr:UDP-N-acetylmuramoyl-L-alanine--D-glutamate ligase [Gammaproteobacteria bacterium]